MAYPVARVGSVTKKGDKVISGVSNHLVQEGGGAGVSFEFDGQVVVFDAEDIEIMGADEPGDAEQREPSTTPNDPGAAGGDVGPEQPGPNGPAPTTLPVDCQEIRGNVSGTTQLSPHFTIDRLTQCPAGRHRLQAQVGLTIPQIICNLRGLCVNILEPMYSHFNGKFIVNSGFRAGSGTSQHNKGQAADCYFPGYDSDQILAAATWIQNNLPFDQMILERSVKTGTRWIHVSFDRNKTAQRRKVNTCPNAGAGRGVETYLSGLRKI